MLSNHCLMERDPGIYGYSMFYRKETPAEKTDRLDQYRINARRSDNGEEIDYRVNFYTYRGYMLITDIFPASWEQEEDCFSRLTSHEGVFVNMRKLAVTSLYIFCREFLPVNGYAAMVVSGSYAPGEEQSGISRKLRIYKNIFDPLLEDLGLVGIDIPELNALIIRSTGSGIDEDRIREDYYAFKDKPITRMINLMEDE